MDDLNPDFLLRDIIDYILRIEIILNLKIRKDHNDSTLEAVLTLS